MHITFNFKLTPFSQALGHLMQHGQKGADELDVHPAKYPLCLDLGAELAAVTQMPKAVVAEPPAVEAPPELVEDEELTGNEGDSTDADEEVAASPAQRGESTLVTASCPREYPRHLKSRQKLKALIPEDFTKSEFLTKLRKTITGFSKRVS